MSVSSDEVTPFLRPSPHVSEAQRVRRLWGDIDSHASAYQKKNTDASGDDTSFEKSMRNDRVRSVRIIRRIGRGCGCFVPFLIHIYAWNGIFVLIPNLPFSWFNGRHLFVWGAAYNYGWWIQQLMVLGCIAIYVLTIWSYAQGSYTHPGPISPLWKQWKGNPTTKPCEPWYALRQTEQMRGTSVALTIISKNSKQFCNKCDIYRPRRSAHCSRCGLCIARMDHHCAFINNCVGINNHRYFIQFIVYVSMGIFLYIISAFIVKLSKGDLSDKGTSFVVLFLLPIVGTFMAPFVLCLLIGQIRNITKNQTYIESRFHRDLQNKSRSNSSICHSKNAAAGGTAGAGALGPDIEAHDMNDFNTGSFFLNFLTIFGRSPIHWFIPMDWPIEEVAQRLGISPSNRVTPSLCSWYNAWLLPNVVRRCTRFVVLMCTGRACQSMTPIIGNKPITPTNDNIIVVRGNAGVVNHSTTIDADTTQPHSNGGTNHSNGLSGIPNAQLSSTVMDNPSNGIHSVNGRNRSSSRSKQY